MGIIGNQWEEFGKRIEEYDIHVFESKLANDTSRNVETEEF